LIHAAKKVALFREATERLRPVEPVKEGWQQAGDVRVLVEVEFSGSRSGSEFRQLGSLTERHGMRMHPGQPFADVRDRGRASVAVPRAKTQREAEEIVASLLEWLSTSHTVVARALDGNPAD